MVTKKNLGAATAGLITCAAMVWFCTSLWGGEISYEVEPQIAISEYRSDAARAIDAYERLMERYMDLTEQNLIGLGRDVEDIVKKLDSIDAKLTRLCAEMARIKKALGIEQAEESEKEQACPASNN